MLSRPYSPVRRSLAKSLRATKSCARFGAVYEISGLEEHIDYFVEKYSSALVNIITEAFLISHAFTGQHSGLVISGFGEKELFPSTFSFNIEGTYKRLKYWDNSSAVIDLDNTVTILPFAQSDVISTFMDGVHPDYINSVNDLIHGIAASYPEAVEKLLAEEADTASKIVSKLGRFGSIGARRVGEEFQNMLRERNSSPIINAVSFLPRDELARLAESLINLTSVKRRMSTDSETVGGPADVAVITKGDGFVWINRKHYFDPKLNHHLMAKYSGGTV
ncbi:hypothetical protein [Endozoicomonas sp. 4G]|uniref:hypothetical protein n=1 Tax=Endozoicomonas sp. 4G TaxID=2872754 RepID=UPI002078C9B3|nr:hypothetical protein [Endozoicomonas sp. 4G]